MTVTEAQPCLGPRLLVVWRAVLVVALAAATATAHGLYEVAHAAGAPAPIAALYPLITDGLALVAYATAMRVDAIGRRYAWTIVVLAAGLSGLAQAAYLADGVRAVPAWLRFGIGAWPALAAAIAAHLLHQLSTSVQLASNVQPARPTVPLDAVQPDVQPAPALDDTTSPAPMDKAPGRPDNPPSAAGPARDRRAAARDRARAAARAHRDRHGTWPTVNELADAAAVARGTAATALKELRCERPSLHVLHTEATTRTER